MSIDNDFVTAINTAYTTYMSFTYDSILSPETRKRENDIYEAVRILSNPNQRLSSDLAIKLNYVLSAHNAMTKFYSELDNQGKQLIQALETMRQQTSTNLSVQKYNSEVVTTLTELDTKTKGMIEQIKKNYEQVYQLLNTAVSIPINDTVDPEQWYKDVFKNISEAIQILSTPSLDIEQLNNFVQRIDQQIQEGKIAPELKQSAISERDGIKNAIHILRTEQAKLSKDIEIATTQIQQKKEQIRLRRQAKEILKQQATFGFDSSYGRILSCVPSPSGYKLKITLSENIFPTKAPKLDISYPIHIEYNPSQYNKITLKYKDKYFGEEETIQFQDLPLPLIKLTKFFQGQPTEEECKNLVS